MNVLIIGRTLPTNTSGSLGLFEFEQANTLKHYTSTGYMFIETSSILTNKKIGYFNEIIDGVPTTGFYLPIKGLPSRIYQSIRTELFKKTYNSFVNEYWTPDIIHIHFPLLVINEGILDFLKEKKCKLVVTEHWSSVQRKNISNNLKFLLKDIYDYSSGFICVSDDLKKSVEELIQESNSNIIVIPNMISNIFFSNNQHNPNSTGDFTFSFIGRLTKIKKVDLLIRAFEDTFKSTDNVYLKIIGDGPERNSLKSLISNDFKKRIMMYGNLPKTEVYNHLLETSVYVSASSYESFGVPFIEAMAMGIPVISADSLPIRTYINSKNGVMFKTDDQQDLSKKIEFMYENSLNFDKNTIQSNVYNNFSEKTVAKKILDVYFHK